MHVVVLQYVYHTPDQAALLTRHGRDPGAPRRYCATPRCPGARPASAWLKSNLSARWRRYIGAEFMALLRQFEALGL